MKYFVLNGSIFYYLTKTTLLYTQLCMGWDQYWCHVLREEFRLQYSLHYRNSRQKLRVYYSCVYHTIAWYWDHGAVFMY